MKLICLILSLACGSIVLGQTTVPSGMTYQGRLTDANSNPLPDGNGYEVEVRLWTTSTGGTTPIWAARYSGIPLKSGAFSLILGSAGGAAIGGAIIDLKTVFSTSPSTYLGLTITKNGGGVAISNPSEILPRQQLLSSPYAFQSEKAEDSAKLAGQPATYYSPTGSIVAFAGSTAPAGWLLCDGSTVTTSAYPGLFNIIGTSFGTNGNGTFKLPDLRGRFPLGTNPTPQPPVSTVRTLSQTGGEEAHTLTLSEMPNHGHEFKSSIAQAANGSGPYIAGMTYADGAQRGLRIDTSNTSSALPIVSTGGGLPHNTMPPFLVLNFIIKH